MRVVLKKSVADEICRRWGFPQGMRKSNPHHDTQGRFASGGGELFGFKVAKLTRGQCRQLAQKCNMAKADSECTIDRGDIVGSAEHYLRALLAQSNKRDKWICSPLFGGARIRFNGDSLRHFFYTGRKRRSIEEIERRAKCLPFIKDILRGAGVKGGASYSETGLLAFAVIGRARVDAKDTAIRVVISKRKSDKYFYLSVNNLGEVLKNPQPPRRRE